MIYGLIQNLRDDVSILIHWMKKEEFKLGPGEEKGQRVQLAAFRVLAFVAMVFGGVWLLTSAITFPAKMLFNLSIPVGIYALAHDVFVMAQNANQEDFFKAKKEKPYLLRLFFKGKDLSDEEQAAKFTHGTFLQPIWMWLYANKKVPLEVGAAVFKSTG